MNLLVRLVWAPACLMAALLVASAPGVDSQDSPQAVVQAKLTLTSLTQIALDATVTFDGDSAKAIRTGLDQQGDKDGKVDRDEAAEVERAFREGLEKSLEEDEDDDQMLLDEAEFNDPEEFETSVRGLWPTDADSTEPIVIEAHAVGELDGRPGAGPVHVLRSVENQPEPDDEGEEDVEGEGIIRVPPGYRITAVQGVEKRNDCEARADMNTPDEWSITFEEADGKCPSLKSAKKAGFGLALPLVGLAGAVAVAAWRRRA